MMRTIKCDAVTLTYDNTDGSQTVGVQVGTGQNAMNDWISWEQWEQLVAGFESMALDADQADDAEGVQE